MSATSLVIHGYGETLEIRPDSKGCTVRTSCPVTLTPEQMRKVAFELLAVAKDRDGKDWVAELDRMRVSQ
jgi:hypothetical protein